MIMKERCLGFKSDISNGSGIPTEDGSCFINHCKPCLGVHSARLPMTSFETFFSFIIIYSKKGACLNDYIAVHSSRLGQAN